MNELLEVASNQSLVFWVAGYILSCVGGYVSVRLFNAIHVGYLKTRVRELEAEIAKSKDYGMSGVEARQRMAGIFRKHIVGAASALTDANIPPYDVIERELSEADKQDAKARALEDNGNAQAITQDLPACFAAGHSYTLTVRKDRTWTSVHIGETDTLSLKGAAQCVAETPPLRDVTRDANGNVIAKLCDEDRKLLEKAAESRAPGYPGELVWDNVTGKWVPRNGGSGGGGGGSIAFGYNATASSNYDSGFSITGGVAGTTSDNSGLIATDGPFAVTASAGTPITFTPEKPLHDFKVGELVTVDVDALKDANWASVENNTAERDKVYRIAKADYLGGFVALDGFGDKPNLISAFKFTALKRIPSEFNRFSLKPGDYLGRAPKPDIKPGDWVTVNASDSELKAWAIPAGLQAEFKAGKAFRVKRDTFDGWSAKLDTADKAYGGEEFDWNVDTKWLTKVDPPKPGPKFKVGDLVTVDVKKRDSRPDESPGHYAENTVYEISVVGRAFFKPLTYRYWPTDIPVHGVYEDCLTLAPAGSKKGDVIGEKPASDTNVTSEPASTFKVGDKVKLRPGAINKLYISDYNKYAAEGKVYTVTDVGAEKCGVVGCGRHIELDGNEWCSEPCLIPVSAEELPF